MAAYSRLLPAMVCELTACKVVVSLVLLFIGWFPWFRHACHRPSWSSGLMPKSGRWLTSLDHPIRTCPSARITPMSWDLTPRFFDSNGPNTCRGRGSAGSGKFGRHSRMAIGPSRRCRRRSRNPSVKVFQRVCTAAPGGPPARRAGVGGPNRVSSGS